MESKDKIIAALCTMYGAGWEGAVKFLRFQDNQWNKEAFIVSSFSDIDFLNREFETEKVKDVYIDSRPFSALMEKDESGICDAERLCKIVGWKSAYLVEQLKVSKAIKLKATGHNGKLIDVTIDTDMTIRAKAGRFYCDDTILTGPDFWDFLRSRAYAGFIPEVLKGGNDG